VGFHILVLAGGSGTRLWPLSRAGTPKHLLPLGPAGVSLLRATLERVQGLGDSVHVVTAAAQADRCREELVAAGMPGDAVIAEPVARGTGPALGLAVAWLAREDPGALVASVHADHRIGDPAAYRAAVVAAAGWAAGTGDLATVGLTPLKPATGLGYIALGAMRDAALWKRPGGAPEQALVEAQGLPAYRSAGFREKPPAEVAEEYVAGGNHLWNLGLFAWRAPVFRELLRAAAPGVAATVDAVVEKRAQGDEAGATAAYASLDGVAIEPLVLERGAPLTVVRASFSWSDLGSWSDLHAARVESGEVDTAGNVVQGDATAVGAADCTVISRGGRLVTVVGATGLVVVDTPDALLVVPEERAQDVKLVVERLRSAGRDGVL